MTSQITGLNSGGWCRNVSGISGADARWGRQSPDGLASKVLSNIPTSLRTVSELRTRADELRRMAQTARTAEVHAALVALAERFEALAVRRSAEHVDNHSMADPKRS
jgi:hypothetical protein